VKSQCLPFGQIPHSTRLFTDFLSYSPQVQQFYPRSPRFSEWLKDEAASIVYDSGCRHRVCEALEHQNKAWGASPKTLENIARLRAGAAAVVTGQQVALFGGPMFSIYKALTAVKLANEATAAGVDCVPVFWLATEDHDLAEVNHVSIPGPDGLLSTLAVTPKGLPEAPVGLLAFGAEIVEVVEAAAGLLGETEVTRWLRECYLPGETLGSAFAKLFARLFAEWGVILLDASDPELHQIAQPIYRAAIEHASELASALLARGEALDTAGYHQQVKVTLSSTLLFGLQKGSRVPIHHDARTAQFVIGDEKVPAEELQSRIAATPQDFSPNVLLRPVVQDYLLPTLSYTGGAAEAAYFAQAAVVYETLAGRITPIVPRFSASIMETKPQALLERYSLTLPDVFSGAERLREILAVRALPQQLQGAFNQAEAALKESLAAVGNALAGLDKTLVESAAHAGEKMQYQLGQLRAKAARAELRQSEIIGRHADLLGNALYPNKTLQEREIAGIYFIARHGQAFLDSLYEAHHTDCLDHQVIAL
jgi:bacillithiol biosynthesis cysteine-adding enzyme BshC